MATRYFRKSLPHTEGAESYWVEMTGREFYDFVNSPEAKGRYFIVMDDLVIETNEQQFRKWLSEKNHSDYLRRCEVGIQTLSLYSDDISESRNGEDVLSDSSDLEELVVTKLRCHTLRAAMSELSADDNYLLYKLYFAENTCSENELAEELGITQQGIHKRKKKILKNLKKLVVEFEKSQQYKVKGKKKRPFI